MSDRKGENMADWTETTTAAKSKLTKTGLKDSGTRQEFSSGAVRDCQSSKGRFDLIPFWPIFAYSAILEAGAQKYAAKNWMKGMPISRYIDSALRHLFKYMSGMRDEPHLWQALWNIAGAVHTQVLIYLKMYPEEFNDLTDDTGKSIELLSEFEKIRIESVVGSILGEKSYPHGV
jgi:Domain of unknown function (DUF5664)